jgi:hypothetical protein
MLEVSIDHLHEDLKEAGGAEAKTIRIRADIQRYERILKDIDKYEFSKSNYNRGYSYLTLDYRYIKPDAKTTSDVDSDQVQVSRKRAANFIFIDQELIDENLPNRHKRVHKYLDQCAILFDRPQMTYYFKAIDNPE